MLGYRPTADHTGIALGPAKGKSVLDDGTRNAQLLTVSLLRLGLLGMEGNWGLDDVLLSHLDVRWHPGRQKERREERRKGGRAV